MVDFLFWISLIFIIMLVNVGAIHKSKHNKNLYIWSGLMIAFLAPFIALTIGAIMLTIDKGSGSDGVIGAVVIGWAVFLNGILYFIIGICFKLFSKR
jgi:hypothetical protein